jgi:hypothetical protein
LSSSVVAADAPALRRGCGRLRKLWFLKFIGSGPGAIQSTPTPGAPLTTSQLKVRLIEQLGPLWYCDPDFYPISRANENDLARQRFGEVQADKEAFAAIAAHLGATPGDTFTDYQKVTLYQLWTQLLAIVLNAATPGTYGFVYVNRPAEGASEGRRTTGTIDDHGTIAVEQQAPAGEPACPICLARGTRIATPGGEVAIEDVTVGIAVWSIDASGRRFVATVLQVGRTPVPSTHEVVRLVLDDGRVVRASPGHPLPDARRLGTIRAGDGIDGARVVSAQLERYDGGFTFDLLPSGPTGTYIADGIPLGSTLHGG